MTRLLPRARRTAGPGRDPRGNGMRAPAEGNGCRWRPGRPQPAGACGRSGSPWGAAVVLEGPWLPGGLAAHARHDGGGDVAQLDVLVLRGLAQDGEGLILGAPADRHDHADGLVDQ